MAKSPKPRHTLGFTQAAGGDVTPILEEENVRFNIQSLSDDGKQIYYTTNKENKTYFDLCTYHLDTSESKTIIHGDKGIVQLKNVSKDGRTLIVSEMYSNTSNLIYRYVDGERETLVPDKEIPHTTVSTIMLENGMVYVATNYESDHVYLAAYDPLNKSFEKKVEIENESIKQLTLSKDELTMYIQTSAGVQDKCYSYDILTGEYTAIELPVTIIEQFQLSSTGTIYLLGGTATKPSNLFRQTASGWEQLTAIKVSGIDENELVMPKVIRYPSMDGLEIEALYHEPAKDKDNGYTILLPHGGPQAADLLAFSSWQQIFAFEGYRVVSPNYRGSTRYGSSFKKMVEGDWGDGPRYDVIACLDYLIDQGWLIKRNYLSLEQVMVGTCHSCFTDDTLITLKRLLIFVVFRIYLVSRIRYRIHGNQLWRNGLAILLRTKRK